MTSGPEWERVERPLLQHLFSLGWETLNWSERQSAGVDFRSSDRDVLLEKRLGSGLEKINRGPDGAPWLDEARISAAVEELRSMSAGSKLLEANRLSTELLLGGVTVDGLPGWDGGRDQTISYIDWDNWEANDFLAVSQFTVATPGRAPNIRPDVTLFVNGIPLVVIEAKPPGHDSGITDAVDQLRRYANQRGSEAAEGAEQLFWTNQFTVATTGKRAEAATFSALPEHYLAWKDPFPATGGEVAASLGKPADAITQQELLTAGMLTPERLLDIVRHFTLFMEVGSGRMVKVVGRYQQYRGVHKALRRLIEGDTRPADGHVDRRGGIIWHTQGSGKSLAMVFLIRAMRSHPRPAPVQDRAGHRPHRPGEATPQHRRARRRDRPGGSQRGRGARTAEPARPRRGDGDDPEVPRHRWRRGRGPGAGGDVRDAERVGLDPGDGR